MKKVSVLISEEEKKEIINQGVKNGFKENLSGYIKQLFFSVSQIKSFHFEDEKQIFNVSFSIKLDNREYDLFIKHAKRLNLENDENSLIRKLIFTKYFLKKKNIETKTVRIQVRVTDEERERIRGLAKEIDLNISDYVKGMCLNKKGSIFNAKTLTDELWKTRSELNKIGTNINQISNYTNYLLSLKKDNLEVVKNLEDEAKYLINEINKTRNVLDKLLNKL